MPSGKSDQVFDGVPYLHVESGQRMWFGFSSAGTPGSVEFVDNIYLAGAKE